MQEIHKTAMGWIQNDEDHPVLLTDEVSDRVLTVIASRIGKAVPKARELSGCWLKLRNERIGDSA